MDEFDRRLLDLVQRDNRRTHENLGEELGLSPSAVRRRLKKLREDGIIVRDVSLLDPTKLGETVIILVRMAVESPQTYAALGERMTSCPEVLQCYTTTGETDFVIIAHFPTLANYDAWAKDKLMSDEAIARYTTLVSSSRVKYETRLPTGV